MPRGKPVDFGFWESFTQSPLYRGQLEPLKEWLRGRVLDVASNYGRFSALSPSTVSIDSEARFLQRGMEMENIRRPVRGSALSLPFRDGSFDTVLAMGIIDHIPFRTIPRFLDELVRVAKSDGQVIIQVTSPYCWFALRHIRVYQDYVHAYSPHRLIRHLRVRGWRRTRVFSSGLVGSFYALPQTVHTLLPWSPHITVAFTRADAA